jgi:nitrous oxidase accessory protein NosD
VSRSATVSVTTGGGGTATIYVSPNGSDSAAGTQAAPYKTLQRAANVARAGDIVSVAPGTYVGFRVSTSGTASNRIVFRASGTVNVTQGSGGYGIYIENASYVTIDGFRVSGTSSKGIAARGATATSPMRGVHVLNNVVTNTREEGMYLSQIESSLVEGNTLQDVGTSGTTTTGHGLYVANAGSDNTIIRGNTFMAANNSWGEALHVNGDIGVGGDGIIKNLTIENNRFLGGFNNGMSLDGVQDSLIRNNIIVDTHHHGIRGYQIDGGGGPARLTIVNNTIYAPGGNAVKTTDDDGSSIVFNNILVGGEGSTSFGMSASTGANLSSFAATRPSFAPTTAAIGTGLTSLAGKPAPATDINGKARHTPPDIGAVEH